jgi:hypothetical protein
MGENNFSLINLNNVHLDLGLGGLSQAKVDVSQAKAVVLNNLI